MDVKTTRALLDARQLALRASRKRQTLAWLEQLETTGDPVLLEAAVKLLGFREREWQGGQLIVIDDGERVPVQLDPTALARLVRARTDAEWTYADVRPLIRPGAARVPARYELLGKVIEIIGELPEVVIDAPVTPGATLAFELGSSYREWMVETNLGYVGTPAPAVGAAVWRVNAITPPSEAGAGSAPPHT